jgi:hypothetical protein
MGMRSRNPGATALFGRRMERMKKPRDRSDQEGFTAQEELCQGGTGGAPVIGAAPNARAEPISSGS